MRLQAIQFKMTVCVLEFRRLSDLSCVSLPALYTCPLLPVYESATLAGRMRQQCRTVLWAGCVCVRAPCDLFLATPTGANQRGEQSLGTLEPCKVLRAPESFRQ